MRTVRSGPPIDSWFVSDVIAIGEQKQKTIIFTITRSKSYNAFYRKETTHCLAFDDTAENNTEWAQLACFGLPILCGFESRPNRIGRPLDQSRIKTPQSIRFLVSGTDLPGLTNTRTLLVFAR